MGLKENLEALEAKVLELTKQMEKAGDEGGNRLRSTAKAAGKRIRGYIEDSPVIPKVLDAKDRLMDYESDLESHVQKRPLVSLLIAFAAGVALSSLFRGKR